MPERVQIKDYEGRLSYARDLLYLGQIDPSDYRDMKSDYRQEISRLESKPTRISNETEDVEVSLTKALTSC